MCCKKQIDSEKISKQIFVKPIITGNNAIMTLLASGKTKNLNVSFNISDAYTFSVTVCAQYSGKKFTGVGSASVSVNSAQLAIVYKVGANNLTTSYTSSKITLGGSVDIDSYVGVGSVGIIKIGTNTCSPSKTWKASRVL